MSKGARRKGDRDTGDSGAWSTKRIWRRVELGSLRVGGAREERSDKGLCKSAWRKDRWTKKSRDLKSGYFCKLCSDWPQNNWKRLRRIPDVQILVLPYVVRLSSCQWTKYMYVTCSPSQFNISYSLQSFHCPDIHRPIAPFSGATKPFIPIDRIRSAKVFARQERGSNCFNRDCWTWRWTFWRRWLIWEERNGYVSWGNDKLSKSERWSGWEVKTETVKDRTVKK